MKYRISSIRKSTRHFAKRYSTELLIAFGIFSGITAFVAGIVETPKALELLDEKKEELGVDELDTIEVIKTAGPCYIPALIAESFSITFLVFAGKKHHQHSEMLMTAYALSESAFKEYREKMVKTLGEKKEKEVRDEISKDRIIKNPPKPSDVSITSTGDQLCYDPLTARYFQSNAEKIRRAVNKINDDMLRGYDGSATLNDFYYELGLTETQLGDELGWENMKTGLVDVQFSVQLASDDVPCLVMDFGNNPPLYFDLH